MELPRERGATMCPKGKHGMPHAHRYTIADDPAVEVFVDELISHGSHQQRCVLNALEDASQYYNTSTGKERKAFFHGLLTGYAVALTPW